jgi:hypothetical protein
MKISYLALALLWMGLASALVAGEKAAYPFSPDQLLTILPETPQDWTLTRSDAELFLGDSVLSKATRIFQAPAKTADASSGTALAPPGEVKIRVLDTASDAPSRADFANFKPGKNGPIEKKFLSSLPAIVFSEDETKQLTQVLVASRYILDITFTNVPQQRVEDWLRSFHFDRLPEKSEVPAAPAGQFHLAHVDELHPEKNRSYFVSVSEPEKLPKPADLAP